MLKNKMIVITKVEFVETSLPIHRIVSASQPIKVGTHHGEDYVYPEYVYESIQGKQIIDARGETYVVGLSKQVQDILKMSWETFDFQDKEIKRLRDENAKLVKESCEHLTIINSYNHMSMWRKFTHLLFKKRL